MAKYSCHESPWFCERASNDRPQSTLSKELTPWAHPSDYTTPYEIPCIQAEGCRRWKPFASRPFATCRVISKTTSRTLTYLEFPQAWVEAVRNDTTIIVLNCGNLERIGIRHRKTQTLYLSELIKIDSYRHPAYGKLEIGLYLAALKDAVDRTLQRLKADVVEQGTQPSTIHAGSSRIDEDHAVTRNQKRRKIEVIPSIHNTCSSSDIANVCRVNVCSHLKYILLVSLLCCRSSSTPRTENSR